MRLKLNLFHLHENSERNVNGSIGSKFIFNKMVFPVNLNENFILRDLRITIEKFLNKLSKCQIEIEYLCLDDFYLMDEFEINSVLNHDDEIRFVNNTNIF